ncbi:hypothetical protein ACIGB6_18155 [Paeniglutamicibacter gangotriensis]|uniref:hypothetical protein n=1 Tax=Paeniglutamicibacter gangotriensis TaxID=254787 RepID=UPI0037CC942A
MMDREQLAKEIFIVDNGRFARDVAEEEWASAGFNQQNYAYAIADGLASVIASRCTRERQGFAPAARRRRQKA